MATSKYPTEQYASTHFVESCGAVLFDIQTRLLCVLRYKNVGHAVLPKGRRDLGEHRADAAIREVREETGLPCKLLPVTLASRQPGPEQNANAGSDGYVPDTVNTHPNVTHEPFYLQVRHSSYTSVKIIYWFIAMVEDEAEVNPDAHPCEEQFTPEWYLAEEAHAALTYANDAEVVKRAVAIVRESGYTGYATAT